MFIEIYNVVGLPVLINTMCIQSVMPQENETSLLFMKGSNKGQLVCEPYEELKYKILEIWDDEAEGE